MALAATLTALALVAVGILVTCGQAARRVLLLAYALVGVPLGLALDWNGLEPGPLLWLLCGAAAAACTGLTDDLALRGRPRPKGRSTIR